DAVPRVPPVGPVPIHAAPEHDTLGTDGQLATTRHHDTAPRLDGLRVLLRKPTAELQAPLTEPARRLLLHVRRGIDYRMVVVRVVAGRSVVDLLKPLFRLVPHDCVEVGV